MRMGLFTDTFFPIVDGVGRVVYNFANQFAAKGQECYVIAPMADTGYRGGLPFELVEFISLGVPTQRQYNTGIPQLDTHYDRRMSKIDLDIVHAHSPFVAGQEAIRIARKRGIPLIGSFHSRYYDDFYKLSKQEMIADIAVRFVVNFYEKCDEVWTVSYSSADTLRDYGYDGDIIVLPNGTPDTAPNEANKALAAKTFSLPERPMLMYCGQLNWKKNIRRILEACALVQKEGFDFSLVLAGQGPDVKEIRETVDSLQLTEKALFTGHITNDRLLYGLYENASLFVFPSLYDTSGMVVREAAALETPSVVVRGSAAAEPIEDGVNGLLCDDSSESLAQVLRRALSDASLVQALGVKARETIYLPWDEIADKALARYQIAIDNRRVAAEQ